MGIFAGLTQELTATAVCPFDFDMSAPPLTPTHRGGGPLPPGWEAATAPDGQTYYINHNTGTTQWEPPSAGGPPPPPPSYAPAAAAAEAFPAVPSPAVPAAAAAEPGIAEQHAECPICFEPLHSAPAGVFVDASGKRVSQHMFNLDSARRWAVDNTNCPVTRKPFASVLEVPDLLTNPQEWFKVVDIDGDGKLSRKEVIEVLKAQLPVDQAILDAVADDPHSELWTRWDPDGSGFIDPEEMLSESGLIHYVREVFAATGAGAAIPSIRSSKEAWFQYWDEDNSLSLEKEELVRALVHTFELGQHYDRLQAMRETIDMMWPMFDTDGSGSIEMDEFVAEPDGLANTIIANLAFL